MEKTLGPRQTEEARRHVRYLGNWQDALVDALGDDPYVARGAAPVTTQDIKKAQEWIRFMRRDLDSLEAILARPSRKVVVEEQSS